MQLIVLPVELADLGKFQDSMSGFLEFVISISFVYLCDSHNKNRLIQLLVLPVKFTDCGKFRDSMCYILFYVFYISFYK